MTFYAVQGIVLSASVSLEATLDKSLSAITSSITHFKHIFCLFITLLLLSAWIQLKILFLTYKALFFLAPYYFCKLIMVILSAISDRLLRSLDHNNLFIPQSRTSASQCLPAQIRAQILFGSFSSTTCLLKSFHFPEAYCCTGALRISIYCEWRLI